ncbi:MAG: ParB/RepB/Spo0J family partition protein [Trueperaceae bacterium]|nr:ParB/RepB/Spo0J family partition protein [Trueperaceae bacterium]
MSAKARGLGRGLDALLPKSEKGPRMVALSSLLPSRFQPRSRLDEAKVAELAASMADKGVLQPLLVRPVEGGFEIVAGERRFRAAQKAGLSSVPAVVHELNDRETLELAIVENLQREDLTALEEARAFERLRGFGMEQEEVARAVGKSRSAVANALRLLSLPEEAQAALDRGEIRAGHARAILAQPEEDRAWALARIVERGLSVRQAEALQRPKAPQGRSASDGRYRELEDDLARHAGTPVRIRGGRKGRIELHFRSREELERLLEMLGYQA